MLHHLAESKCLSKQDSLMERNRARSRLPHRKLSLTARHLASLSMLPNYPLRRLHHQFESDLPPLHVRNHRLQQLQQPPQQWALRRSRDLRFTRGLQPIIQPEQRRGSREAIQVLRVLVQSTILVMPLAELCNHSHPSRACTILSTTLTSTPVAIRYSHSRLNRSNSRWSSNPMACPHHRRLNKHQRHRLL